MNLTHGPDGAIWVTDYYREIIEDYSAIPRHLQQQYGLYNGHDCGRIYRLIHRDLPQSPKVDLGQLNSEGMALECASSILWRRQTAQRLIAERHDRAAAPVLRRMLAQPAAEPFAIIAALRTLDEVGVLGPPDVAPLVDHPDPAVRVHALQLGDHWFAADSGTALLDAALTCAAHETNGRVQIQLALSLGEARDPRAFAALTRYAQQLSNVRWMDAAILSSIAGREADLLSELLRVPGPTNALLSRLAQAIGSGRNETNLARALKLAGYARPEIQTVVLDGLAVGRKNAPRKPLSDPSARSALTNFIHSSASDVSNSALTLAQTFIPTLANDEDTNTAPAALSDQVSEATFRRYIAALTGQRDLARGHELFVQACTPCHRISNEGNEVGPDLIGQLGMAEEALLKDILLPSERIRPGYESTQVRLRDGAVVTGLLKDDGATSLLLIQAGGIEQTLLRKDVVEVQRLATSLMPPFAETLTPLDVANLLAWLRSNLGISPAVH